MIKKLLFTFLSACLLTAGLTVFDAHAACLPGYSGGTDVCNSAPAGNVLQVQTSTASSITWTTVPLPAAATSVVTSFNGATGTIIGVNSVNGATGTVTIAGAATTSINGVAGPLFTFSIVGTSSPSSITTSSANIFLNLLKYVSSSDITVTATGSIIFASHNISQFTNNSGYITSTAASPTGTPFYATFFNASGTPNASSGEYLVLVSSTTAPASVTNYSIIYSGVQSGISRPTLVNECPVANVMTRDTFIVGFNDSGVTETVGQPVYNDGNAPSGIPYLALAKANSTTTLPAIAAAEGTITNGSYGCYMTEGILNVGSTTAYIAGQPLYVSPTVAGGITQTRPTEPNLVVHVGSVITATSTNGKINFNFPQIILGKESGTAQPYTFGSTVSMPTIVTSTGNYLYLSTGGLLVATGTPSGGIASSTGTEGVVQLSNGRGGFESTTTFKISTSTGQVNFPGNLVSGGGTPTATSTGSTAVLSSTTVFAYNAATTSYVVPAGITQLVIQAAGTAGKWGANASAAGGNGAVATGTLPVTPGQTLYVGFIPGGAGAQPGISATKGGDGGYAAYVSTSSASFNVSTSSATSSQPIVVAAGGGGAGNQYGGQGGGGGGGAGYGGGGGGGNNGSGNGGNGGNTGNGQGGAGGGGTGTGGAGGGGGGITSGGGSGGAGTTGNGTQNGNGGAGNSSTGGTGGISGTNTAGGGGGGAGSSGSGGTPGQGGGQSLQSGGGGGGAGSIYFSSAMTNTTSSYSNTASTTGSSVTIYGYTNSTTTTNVSGTNTDFFVTATSTGETQFSVTFSQAFPTFPTCVVETIGNFFDSSSVSSTASTVQIYFQSALTAGQQFGTICID